MDINFILSKVIKCNRLSWSQYDKKHLNRSFYTTIKTVLGCEMLLKRVKCVVECFGWGWLVVTNPHSLTVIPRGVVLVAPKGHYCCLGRAISTANISVKEQSYRIGEHEIKSSSNIFLQKYFYDFLEIDHSVPNMLFKYKFGFRGISWMK